MKRVLVSAASSDREHDDHANRNRAPRRTGPTLHGARRPGHERAGGCGAGAVALASAESQRSVMRITGTAPTGRPSAGSEPRPRALADLGPGRAMSGVARQPPLAPGWPRRAHLPRATGSLAATVASPTDRGGTPQGRLEKPGAERRMGLGRRERPCRDVGRSPGGPTRALRRRGQPPLPVLSASRPAAEEVSARRTPDRCFDPAVGGDEDRRKSRVHSELRVMGASARARRSFDGEAGE